MKSHISFVILISLVLCGIFGTSFSKQEVMSIKTKNGIFDCIDFYKQPAFNHPMLKNLAFEEKRLPNLAKLQRQQVNGDVGLKDGGCPIGTVPILRLNPTPADFSPPRPPLTRYATCAALIQTKISDDPNQIFYGVAAAVGLWKPFIQTKQWSSARLKLINGQESIEAGWVVASDVYKDNEAHLYAELRPPPACSSPPCTSFVQVSTDVPLGLVPGHYSGLYEQTKWFWNMSIDKHGDDGHWWLTFGNSQTKVGYWPKQALTALKDGAHQADWGGEIDGGPLEINPPEMGSSMKASFNTKVSSCIFRISLVKQDYQRYLPDETRRFLDCEEYYTVKDAGYVDDYYGRTMFYGGPATPNL